MEWLFRNFLCEMLAPEDDGGGGGSSDDDDENDDDSNEEQERESDGQGGTPADAFNRLLQRHNNDPRAAAEHLFHDNWRVRANNRLLRTQNQELQRRQPKSGAVMLTRDEAAQWRAYKELGDPKTVRQELETGRETSKELTTLRKDASLREVAEAANYNFRALKRVAGDLAFTVKQVDDTDAEGGKRPQAFVRFKDGDTDKEEAIEAYAEREWPDMLPALEAAGTGTAASRSNGAAQERRFVRQVGPQQRSGGKQQSAAASVIGARYPSKSQEANQGR